MPTPARRGTAIVAHAPQFPGYCAKDLIGQRIDVVEVILDFVNAGGGITYLDDRHGYGWTKVTTGRGGPTFDHSSTEIEPGSFTPHETPALAAADAVRTAISRGVRRTDDQFTFHRTEQGWAQGVVLHLTDPSDSLKMLRETLSAVQNGAAGVDRMKHSERIGRIIAEIDRQRPLGHDGKHGNRDTETCGCANRQPTPPR